MPKKKLKDTNTKLSIRRSIKDKHKKLMELHKQYAKDTKYTEYSFDLCAQYWAKFRKILGCNMLSLNDKEQSLIYEAESKLFRSMYHRTYAGDKRR